MDKKLFSAAWYELAAWGKTLSVDCFYWHREDKIRLDENCNSRNEKKTQTT